MGLPTSHREADTGGQPEEEQQCRQGRRREERLVPAVPRHLCFRKAPGDQ